MLDSSLTSQPALSGLKGPLGLAAGVIETPTAAGLAWPARRYLVPGVDRLLEATSEQRGHIALFDPYPGRQEHAAHVEDLAEEPDEDTPDAESA